MDTPRPNAQACNVGPNEGPYEDCAPSPIIPSHVAWRPEWETFAPATEAAAARADGVWDAAYADAIERGESHPAAQAYAADAVVLDSRGDAVDVPAGRPTLLDRWTSSDDLGSR